VVDTEVAFPPCKEFLYLPSEFVNESNLLCCQVKPTCGNPIFCVIDGESDKSERFPGLIDSGSTQQNNFIIEDVAVWIDLIAFYTLFSCNGFDLRLRSAITRLALNADITGS
jgi:hypothetical protein